MVFNRLELNFRIARQPPPGALAILALMQPDQQVVSAWRASAPFWEKHREIIQQMFAPVTQALVEDGLIGSGNAVLDIATGPGEPALTIAGRVGYKGEVFGSTLRPRWWTLLGERQTILG
jgi:ubiquinone/menaquinone biosynthesis C-methylase UbiE